MEFKAAQIVIVNMMHEHNLRGWSFGWMDLKRTIADCNCRGRVIRFSRAFVPAMSEDEIRQTVLHEIAHALTPGHGHDSVWQAKARSLGYRGGRTADGIKRAVTAPYVATCAGGHTVERFRMSSHMRPGAAYCSECYKTRGVKNFFEWKHTANGQPVFPEPKPTSATPAFSQVKQPVRSRSAAVAAYNGRGAYDRGFTDIEALFGD